ncbi:PAS domain-containing protein [Jannaschia sp. S6380]|uniref:chemotaxis protein CheB n=1 Tax=Jannaschia sp. S6380 TaxID=2926408 RepID=UPI001FF4D55D|nr:chemotaxis protein CheB [Jannaschia sp. S6380]MCK0169081.1 PAS domain-containing protein [Jannaschia sp. S6380]
MDDAIDETTDHPVVGIGASAGGLEALQQLVEKISPDSGASYVVVQHLSPDHDSIMDQLLQAHTRLNVRQMRDGMELEPNAIYVNPPGSEMTVEGLTLRLTDRPSPGHLQAPIDRFLRSLADQHGRNAYCVILSGTGSDGTEGLRAIKAAGGIAIVQESGNARFPGMPNSAAATGQVDFILRASEIPARLDDIIHHRIRLNSEEERKAIQSEIEGRLPEIVKLLQQTRDHDFSGYKPGTLVRRIERRMSLGRLRAVDTYIDRLEEDEEEAQRLLQDFMIGVTRFFRDPENFEALNERIIKPLIAKGPEAIRAWVPGCSTGEEAYSVAMLLVEATRAADIRIPIQVFGTDIDIPALGHAREGLFRPSAVETLPMPLLEEYFREEDKGWRAIPLMREICVFAPHNLVRDPPYSRLDLITCRNLMIYMSSDLQKHVIPRFHFALKSGGGLMLGPSEGLAGKDELFEVIDKSHRIFRRNDNASGQYAALADRRPKEGFARVSPPAILPPGEVGGPGRGGHGRRERQAERAFLDNYAGPFALVGREGTVTYLSREMARFARPAAGIPSTRIEAFLAGELRLPVRGAIAEAAASLESVEVHNIVVNDGAENRLYDISVSPVEDCAEQLLVVLHPVRFRGAEDAAASVEARRSEDRFMLERELASVREQLVQLQYEHETSKQEADSSNEELTSMNEELHNSNQELATSREELQSINEELETVNAELTENNRRLVRANSDLKNLFESTDMATLFLDRSLSVRGFTPATTRLFGIKDRDIGRPIRDLSSRIEYPELEADAEDVQRTLQMIEREVSIPATEETFILRVRPYRTTDDRLDGYVLAFYDISDRKRNEEQLARNERDLARQYGELETLYDTTPVGLSLMDKELRWLRINRELADINGFSVEDHIGKRQDELIPDIDKRIATQQMKVFETGEAIRGLQVEGYTPKDPDRLRHWVVDYYPVKSEGEVFAVGTCVREVTEEYALSRDLAQSEARLRMAATQNPVHFVQIDQRGNIVWAEGGLAGLPGSGDTLRAFRDDLSDDVGRIIDDQIAANQEDDLPKVFDVRLTHEGEPLTYQVNLDRLRQGASDDQQVFVFTDVTERRELEDRQRVLLSELQHRVKNTLATVSAIARFLVAGASTPDEYRQRLDERLSAISRTHDLLTNSDWRGTTLTEIIEVEAAAYVDKLEDRIKVKGDTLNFTPREAVSVGMGIHELLTNAAKYGALSTEDGEIDVTTANSDGRRLVWKERNGPTVVEPDGEGFGSFLIEKVLRAELRGEIEMRFERDGLECRMALPTMAATEVGEHGADPGSG